MNICKPKKFIYVSGRTYQLNYKIDLNPIDAVKYAEMFNYQPEDSIVKNIYKFIALFATPVKWRWWKFVPYERDFEAKAQDLSDLGFNVAYQLAVFFYTHYRVSLQLAQPYIIDELLKKGVSRYIAKLTINNAINILDEFKMPEWSQTIKEYSLNSFCNN